MGRTFVVGDIHACKTELQELLNTINLQSEDHFISLGDLIHKHKDPQDSIRVLQIIHNLQQVCTVTVVAGNHEEKQLRWQDTEIKCTLSGKTNPIQYTEGFAEIFKNSNIDCQQVMLGSQLYLQTEGFLLLHGGLPSGLRTLPDNCTLQQLKSLPSDIRERSKWLLFTRFVNPEGYPVPLGQEKPEDHYWAEQYDGRYGTILFGHQPYLQDQVRKFPHAIGLDLGCVYGNYLAAVQISKGQVVKEYYIKAHRQYDKPYFLE